MNFPNALVWKRNSQLHAFTVALVEEIKYIDLKAARWIAKNALNELQKTEKYSLTSLGLLASRLFSNDLINYA